MKKCNVKCLFYPLLIFFALSLCYIILAYTLGKEMNCNLSSMSWTYVLIHYPNYILPTLAVGIIFYVFFGCIIWYGDKKGKDFDFIFKCCLFFIIALSIIIVGVQSSKIKYFESDIDFSINRFEFNKDDIALITKQTNIHFYLPQCYLIAVEILQIIWAGIMLVCTFQSAEHRQQRKELCEERKELRKERQREKLQDKLDKLN